MPALPPLCTQTDIENRLSVDGVAYRIDDDPTVIDSVIENAGSYISECCLLRYSATNLLASIWVKHRATDIAAYLVCERRGNPVPAGIARAFERLFPANGSPGVMEKIRRGQRMIPDIPERRDAVPVLSNMRVKLAPFPHAVVETNRSPKRNLPTDYAQNVDPLDYLYDYVI